MTSSLCPLLPVLLVDDEDAWLNSFGLTLRSVGMTNIITCNDSRQVMAILKVQDVSVLVLDLTMPYLMGDELLAMVVKEHPDIPVIIITGLDQVETAVSCMKLGAYDFFTKVAEQNRLTNGVRRAIEMDMLRRENSSLKEHFFVEILNNPEAFSAIVTHNKGMLSIFQYIEAIATTCEPVLITGETGVGKGLFAQAVHRLSRRSGEFVAINIDGLDDTVISDTLFGHRKGAFTGAELNKKGMIATAANGSVFLNEIGDLGPGAQEKLLRLIQGHEYCPLGSEVAIHTNVKMIFATHQDIDSLQETGKFRRDLFFRLRAHHVHIPPLRERLDDLPLLLDYFLEDGARRLGKKKPFYPRELLLLGTYHYPGNVREFQSMVFDAVSKHHSRILSMDVFKAYINKCSGAAGYDLPPIPQSGETVFAVLDRLPTLKESGRLLIQEALNRTQGNQAIAAQMLGVTRQALNWRLKQDG